MRLLNTLPQTAEACDALDVLAFETHVEHGVTDDDLAEVLPYCPGLQEAYLSGIRDLSDRTLILLGHETDDLRRLDLTDCRLVSPLGVRELAGLATRLQVLRLRGVWSLTDSAVSTLVRALGHLTELDLGDLPLLTAHATRDIWEFGSRKLRTLSLARCVKVSSRGFPSPLSGALSPPKHRHRKTLVVPPSEAHMGSEDLESKTCPEKISPLILPGHHILEHLHYLDFEFMPLLTDEAISGLVLHAPRIIELNLSGCTGLTNKVAKSLCRVGERLQSLDLSFITSLTDDGIRQIVRGCPNLRQVNVSYCTQLTDLSVLEMALLPGLQQLYIINLVNITDIALQFLAEHTLALTKLQISGCNQLSLGVVHLVLRRFTHLEALGACIPCMARIGVQRFSEPEPAGWSRKAQGPYRKFKGANVAALRRFLDKEEERRRDAERRCIPFTPRGDDSMDLY